MSVTRSSLLGVSGFLLVAGWFPAAAADDGYENVLSSVATAVGIMKTDAQPEIDYRERAPLVLPPKMDLVQPSKSIARPASWPQDPDVTRRRKAASDGRAPSANLLGNERNVLSKDALLKDRINGAQDNEIPESSRRASQCGQNGNGKNCLALSPDELKRESEHYAESNPDTGRSELKPGDEPERVYLTQPPKGYLTTTKVVKVTTEAPKMYHDESNPAAALVYKEKTDD